MSIRQSIRNNFLGVITLMMLLSVLVTVLLPAHVAADLSPVSRGGLPTAKANQENVKNILDVVFGIIGAFALLNITFSGLKYITSAGNPQRTSEAKNGIVYSLIGLVIAITATAIVAFVVKRT